jgi:alpha-glucosidase (family GH31 glycosyl hydrolase)
MLLITPVLDQGASTVRGYFPNDQWYSLYEYNYGQVQSIGFQNLSAPTTSLPPIHVRGMFS